MSTLVADRSSRFTESVIREMTRLCVAYHGRDGINLAQGFPDFPAPQVIKDATCAAIQDDDNQYAITWGAKALRDAIPRKPDASMESRSIRSAIFLIVVPPPRPCC